LENSRSRPSLTSLTSSDSLQREGERERKREREREERVPIMVYATGTIDMQYNM
jgi:hypothetical protein